MGDRGNVQVKETASDNGVFFYTHWSGSELPKIVAHALDRGKGRWGDTPYLSRIIFCEMVKGQEAGETGYGISTQECDQNHPLIVVDDGARVVSIDGEVLPYSEFIERHK
jgi:hypothetical protein